MKTEKSTKIYKSLGFELNQKNINKNVKAIIFVMNGKSYTLQNGNFGTRRKYADFTEAKKAAGLHELQIVFYDIDDAHLSKMQYIAADGSIQTF